MAYELPSALIGGICWCAESHACSLGSTLRQLAPPQRPTGLVDWMGLPVSSAGWVICRYSPALSEYMTGVLAAAALTLADGFPPMAAFGRMVTSVPSW